MESSIQQQGFDLQVVHRDEKGRVIKINPYTMRVIAAPDGGKTRIFERPVGSGNMWDKKGNPIGRWENSKFVAGAKHIEYTPPETEDQKLAKSVVEKDAKISALQKELESLKAETAKKKA